MISTRERDAVKCWFAKFDAAREVWNPLKAERRLYQDVIANKFPDLTAGGNTINWDTLGDADWGSDQVNVNLSSRVVAYIQSKCFDSSPEIRIAGMRDEDARLAAMNEHLITRVMERGGAPSASRDAVVDMATLGPWILWLGVETVGVDHTRMAGFSTDPTELVLAAAQGLDVHPIPGMDLLQLADIARNLHASAPWELTQYEKLNILRLATEAEEMFQTEQAKPPMFQPKRIWYRSMQYGIDALLDSRVWDRKDAAWIARRISMSVPQFKAYDAFKPSLRKSTKPQVLGKESGHQWIELPDNGLVGEEMNQVYDIWEIWDREGYKVHYVTEGCDSYLEKDSTYPYTGEDGLPYFDDFFPCEWAVPYMHNRRTPDRPLGQPMLSYCFPQQLEINKLESEILADSKRSARMFIVSPNVDPDTRVALKEGVDGTIIEESQDDHLSGKPTVSMLPNPSMGNDKLIARKLATEDFYALASVAPSQITGEPVAGTLGQEELVTRGAGDVQGDIVAVIQSAYSGLSRKTAALIRHVFTNQEAMKYLDHKYITPLIDQDTGEVKEESPFKQWKKESLDGVNITASFATKGDAEDPQKISQLLQALQLVLSGRDSSGLPYKDPKPLMELLFRRLGIGVVPDYQASQNELAVQAIKQLLQQSGGKGPGLSPQGPLPSAPPAQGGGPGRAAAARAGRGRGGVSQSQVNGQPPPRI